MVASSEKQKMLARKLQVLKAITRSKSEKKSDIVKDALIFINLLKHRVEQMTREHEQLMKQPNEAPTMEVKVEKLENSCFMLKVKCEKTEDLLISVLEAFEKMGLEVLHADIDTSNFFDIEAIMEAEDPGLEVEDVTQTIYKVLREKGVKVTGSNN